MATQVVRITPEEYFKLQRRPWPELVGGELRERGLPTNYHSWIQLKLGGYLIGAGLSALSEIHLNLGNGEYRVADLAAFQVFP